MSTKQITVVHCDGPDCPHSYKPDHERPLWWHMRNNKNSELDFCSWGCVKAKAIFVLGTRQ